MSVLVRSVTPLAISYLLRSGRSVEGLTVGNVTCSAWSGLFELPALHDLPLSPRRSSRTESE